MFRSKLFIAALCGVFSVASMAGAQETNSVKKDVKTPTTKLTLDAKGNLVGKVFAKVNGKNEPVEAKMSLIREGVVVKTVFADEAGSYSFGGIAPGKYAITGSAATYVGMQPVAVVAAPVPAAVAPVQNNMVLSSPSYNSYAYAPAASYGSCSTCGGGGFGGGIGSGRLFGGNRRLLRLGLIGGVVGIAVSGDSSPDN